MATNIAGFSTSESRYLRQFSEMRVWWQGNATSVARSTFGDVQITVVLGFPEVGAIVAAATSVAAGRARFRRGSSPGDIHERTITTKSDTPKGDVSSRRVGTLTRRVRPLP